MRGGCGSLRGLADADSEDRAGPQHLPDAARGQIGLAHVHAVDAGTGCAGGEGHIDPVVDDECRVLAARCRGERVGDRQHFLEESTTVGVLGTHLDRPHSGGDGGADRVGHAASRRRALVGVGHEVDRPPVGVARLIGDGGLLRAAHAATTIRVSSARSAGRSPARSSRKHAANVPGPAARRAARSEATA